MTKDRLGRKIVGLCAAKALRVSIWLSAIAMLALPATQLQSRASAAEPALLEAMALGLRSTTTAYHSHADSQVLAPSALNRVKRFACVCPSGRGATGQAELSSRLVILPWNAFAAPGRYLISTPRSPPVA